MVRTGWTVRPNRQIANELGVHINTADKYLRLLDEAGLVRRAPDPARPGGPWTLTLLFDPLNPNPPYRLTSPNDQNGDQFRQFPRLVPPPKDWGGVPPKIGGGSPQRLGGGDDLIISTRAIQGDLFEKTTTTETESSSSSSEREPEPEPEKATATSELASDACKLFPELSSNLSLIDKLIADYDIQRVALALELGQVYALKGNKPRIARWLRGTLQNWKEDGRSIESIPRRSMPYGGARKQNRFTMWPRALRCPQLRRPGPSWLIGD